MRIEDLTKKDLERFWSKVDKRGEDECWNWLGYTDRKNVGFYFGTDYSIINVRHIIYYLYYNNIAKGAPIGRTCENDICCNPKHLYIKEKDVEKDWIFDSKLIKRFWKKVKILDVDKCWEWQASTDYKGYGHFNINYHTIRSHRVSYMIEHGKDSIPEGISVCHSCDNRLCVNPNHLFLGTNYDNVQDRHNKGRDGAARGELHGQAKLKDDDVCYIRNSFASKEKTKLELCEMFNMSESAIKGIIRGACWKTTGGIITNRGSSKKLDPDQVLDIKKSSLDKNVSIDYLAEKYNLSEMSIRNILNGRTWRNINL